MRIIFIRHGDPDYENDTLTEKGWREARLLAKRAALWDVSDFYCSPLGRAQATASCTLEETGRSARTYDWLQEFAYRVTDPVTGRYGVPWDFMPAFWTREPAFYQLDGWYDRPPYSENPELKKAYFEVCAGLDGLLSSYGYERRGNYYCFTKEAQREKTIVLFCHLGVTCVMLSHLLNISPVLLWHGVFLAPTSVTVACSEERQGQDAYFRLQTLGDTTHLHDGGEPVSEKGYFAPVFQEPFAK